MKKLTEKPDYRIVLCIILFSILAISLILRISEDDEIEIPYNIMKATDDAYINDELGIIDVPAGGVNAEDKIYANIGKYAFLQGRYDIRIVHACPEDSVLTIKDGSRIIQSVILPGKQSETKTEVYLDEATDDFLMEFSYKGKENIQLKQVIIRTKGLFHIDSLISGILLIIIPCVIIYIRKKNKNFMYPLIGIVFAVILVSAPLFSGSYVGGFDIGFHLMRMEGIRDGLLEGKFPVVIYPAAKYEHGYLGALYPSLFMYIPALLRIIGVSEPNAFNIFVIMISCFTGWSAYVSVKGITGSIDAAFASAVLYCLLPFRVYNIYVGSEIGALLGMAFYPLVLWGIYEILLGNFQKWYILTLAFSGLIESHVLSTVFMALLCLVLLLIFSGSVLKEKVRIVALVKSAVCCIIINLFFLVPFLYYQKDIRYNEVLRDKDPVRYALSIGELFRLDNRDTLYPTAGIVTAVIVSIIAYYYLCEKSEKTDTDENKKRVEELIAVFSALGVMSLFIATSLFPWKGLKKIESIWYMIKIIQLPWRTLSIAGILLSVAVVVIVLNSSSLQKNGFVIIGFIVLLSLASDMVIIDDIRTQAYSNDKLMGGWNSDFTDEYTPHNYKSDAEIEKDTTYIVTGDVDIFDYKKDETRISFSYSSKKGGSIRVPLIYYRGYNAQTSGGEKLSISESDIGTIMIELPLTKGDTVVLEHIEPWHLRAAELISFVFFLVFIVMLIIKKKSRESKYGNI
ncbi:MAG: hypothetical protein K6F99_11600 [Lachnospiraceae bacterium]|nr:hypothetical protein [Lachnospiraceae bacterium]